MYFFTADEHYGHENVIKYCYRPFSSVDEMDDILIKRHNDVVQPGDTVVHAGDFSLKRNPGKYISRLNGGHVFLAGSHDYWLKGTKPLRIWEKLIESQYIVICHYAMRTWARSHYGSWQLHGHSHCTLPPLTNQLDIGVDCHDFYPVSFEELKHILGEET